MGRKYSVFVFNVASCSDRYCSAYGPELTMEQMFDRVKSIPLLSAVDLVLNPVFINDKERIVENVRRTGLKAASVAENAEWLDCLESLIDHADMDEIYATIAKNDGIAYSKLMRKLLRG
jgi:hypothetical protein